MTNYTEYSFYSGDIVFCSLGCPRGEGFIAINFLQGYGRYNSASIKSIGRGVREEVYKEHRDA